jgi:hypothetical protein
LALSGLSAITLAAALTGCEVPKPSAEQAKAEGGPPEPVYVDPASEQGKRLADAKRDARVKAEQAKASEDPITEPGSSDGTSTDATPGKLVEAKVGEGKWKRYEPGFVTTSLNAYFAAKHIMAFNQAKHGLKLFRAQHGRKPKDMAEIKAEILGPVRLPELQPGDEYIYVPENGPDGEIMIRRKE